MTYNTRIKWNINVYILIWLYKTKYGENLKLSYMDTESFIVYLKLDDIDKDIAKDVEMLIEHCLKEKIKK